MIIETRDDVVRLSGSLNKNQWLTIRAAANLLLHDHPQGIIIDCEDLVDVSEDGARTFLEAMRDIEAAKARIVVANLPANVRAVCRTVPGVRSQLPIADSVEEARASLRMASHPVAQAGTQPARRGAVILVPLMAELDLTYGAHLAGRLARGGQAEVRLTYFLEVARTMPLGAPLLQAEQAAQLALAQALELTKPLNVPVVEHVERVRDVREGIIAAIKIHQCDMVVIGATAEAVSLDQDNFRELVQILLQRAPCEVVLGRLKSSA